MTHWIVPSALVASLCWGSLDVDVDVVVGGATAAARLARKGAKVALVEAGPWRDPKDCPPSIYGGMRDLMDNWGTTVARGRAYSPVWLI